MAMDFGVRGQITTALTFRIAILMSDLLERKENGLEWWDGFTQMSSLQLGLQEESGSLWLWGSAEGDNMWQMT